jgi:hypothetical protein
MEPGSSGRRGVDVYGWRAAINRPRPRGGIGTASRVGSRGGGCADRVAPAVAGADREPLGAEAAAVRTSVFAVFGGAGLRGFASDGGALRAGGRGPRFRTARVGSVPIETAPAEEGQSDWTDCKDWAARWGWDHEGILRRDLALVAHDLVVVHRFDRS